ncbi:MAG TPA: TlpA disulfide reductase family protein [Xanthobacteraceae bacterium]|jgi:thiol-disulfide isomerase/thioredoxin
MMKSWSLVALLILSLPLGSPGLAGANELHPFVRGSWKAILAAHAGQPTIVHFWGVTCGPCRVEMPRWAELLQELPDVHLIVINADLVPNEGSAVAAMLAQTGLAGAENWMFVDGFVERLRYEIDPQWHGEIPRTILIARDGSVTTIEGPADFKLVKTWLDREGSANSR